MDADQYVLTMDQIKKIVFNAMVYAKASDMPAEQLVEAVPGLVGFVVYQDNLR